MTHPRVDIFRRSWLRRQPVISTFLQKVGHGTHIFSALRHLVGALMFLSARIAAVARHDAAGAQNQAPLNPSVLNLPARLMTQQLSRTRLIRPNAGLAVLEYVFCINYHPFGQDVLS